MKFVIRGLTFVLIPFLVSGVLALARRGKKAQEGKVYLSKFMLILGLIATTLFLIPTVITAFFVDMVWLSLGFFLFALLGASLIVAYINCRISYDDHQFVSKSFFGIKRTFTYDQVTAVKQNVHECYLYVGKHRVMIDEFSIGGIEFLTLVKKKYKKLHGQPLPQITKGKFDIFNGNVASAGEMIFAYVLMGVLMIGFAAFMVWTVYFNPSTIENTEQQEVTWISCKLQDDEYILLSSDNRLYKIQFIGEGLNAEGIQAVCDGQTPVIAYTKEVHPDDADDYDAVKAILHGDTYLLSFEQTNRWRTEEQQSLLFLPIVFIVLCGGFITMSIIVGRNPKRFSKRVVRMFFKSGYIRE